MRRRDIIKAIAGSAAVWPLAARAQQSAMQVVGFLNAGSPTERLNLVATFRQALGEAGYVEGRNVSIEYRWAENQYDRLPRLAADLVQRQVAAIATPGSTPAALAAKAATATIPIVFGVGGDPVRLGLVASLSRPGGNVTGISFLTTLLVTKQLDLLHELVPSAETIGLLVNPKFPDTEAMTKEAREAATSHGKKLLVVSVSNESDFNQAFATLVHEPVGALLVPVEPFFLSQRKRIVEMADRHALPAIYSLREFAVDGGLMSYGTSLVESYRQVAVYVGRILNGARPADLPVVQSTKFELVINIKVAKALGLQVPDKLLSLADEVIE